MQDFIKKTLDSTAACLKAATWPTRHCSQTANLPRPVFQFAWWSKFDTTVNQTMRMWWCFLSHLNSVSFYVPGHAGTSKYANIVFDKR